MKIVVDAFGGDYSPHEIIDGGILALEKDPELEVVFTGKEKIIRELSSGYTGDKSRIEIIDCSDVITNDDSPTAAIKEKTDSSLVKAFEALKSRDDIVGLVSAGNTGAVLTGSLLKIGRIKGIKRPGLAPIFPTVTGGNVLLIDGGANVDCKSDYLVQFAVMGSEYMKLFYHIENPKVGLLSNGAEDKKGNELTKETFLRLKEMKEIHFIGNVEGRDVLTGNCDVVVADGFAGNVVLKTCEGVSNAIFKLLKKEIYASFRTKLGGALLKPAFRNLSNTMDYNKKGGAVFLGVEKIVLKAHGSTKAEAFSNAVLQAEAMYKAGIIDSIKKAAEKFEN